MASLRKTVRPNHAPTSAELSSAIDKALKENKKAKLTAKKLQLVLEKKHPTWKLPERRVAKFMKMAHAHDDDSTAATSATEGSGNSVVTPPKGKPLRQFFNRHQSQPVVAAGSAAASSSRKAFSFRDTNKKSAAVGVTKVVEEKEYGEGERAPISSIPTETVVLPPNPEESADRIPSSLSQPLPLQEKEEEEKPILESIEEKTAAASESSPAQALGLAPEWEVIAEEGESIEVLHETTEEDNINTGKDTHTISEGGEGAIAEEKNTVIAEESKDVNAEEDKIAVAEEDKDGIREVNMGAVLAEDMAGIPEDNKDGIPEDNKDGTPEDKDGTPEDNKDGIPEGNKKAIAEDNKDVTSKGIIFEETKDVTAEKLKDVKVEESKDFYADDNKEEEEEKKTPFCAGCMIL